MYYSQTRACLCRSMCPIYSEKPWHWLPKKRRTLNWAKQKWRGLAMCFLGIGSGSVSYRMVHDMVCSWHCKLLVFSELKTSHMDDHVHRMAEIRRIVGRFSWLSLLGVGPRGYWSGSSKRIRILKIWILQWILRNERCSSSGFEQS